MSRRAVTSGLDPASGRSHQNNSSDHKESDHSTADPSQPLQIPNSSSSRNEARDVSPSPEKKSIFSSKVLKKFGALELENKASVARDHLALERTFLAWLRTSLAFASIGVAITQLFRLNSTISTPSAPDHDSKYLKLRHVGKPLGATFLAVSIIVLLIGMNRYYESQSWLLKGKFPASRGSILLLFIMSALLIVCSLVVVLVVEPTVRT